MMYKLNGVEITLVEVKKVSQHKKKITVLFENGKRMLTTFKGEGAAKEAYQEFCMALGKYREENK